MDNNFKEIMISIVTLAETIAEQSTEYNHNQKDEVAEKNSEQMHKDFIALNDKLKAPDFDGILTYHEYTQLAVAAYIASNQVKNRIATLRAAVKGYEENIIPKLSRIVDETKTDDDAQKLADEILIFEPNE